MRVALVSPIAPLRGGIAHHTEGLVDALVRGGHEVRVLSYLRQYPRLWFPGRSERDDGQARPRVPVAHTLTSLGPLRWLEGIRALRAFAPDVVVVAWWNAALLGPTSAVLAAAGAYGWRGVVLAHNVATHEGRGRSLVDGVAWRTLATLADGVLTHAADDGARLSHRFPELPVAVHPHPRYGRFLGGAVPRHEARARLGLSVDDELALCLGNVRPYKGVDVAIAAVASLARARPRLRLVVAGELYGDGREAIRQAAAAAPAGRVTLVDSYLSDEEVSLYASAADVLVAAHRRASHSGVVQVAKALGLPVIATRTGGLPELVDEDRGDVLVPPGDPLALAAALDAFFARGVPRSPSPTTPLAAAEEWDALAAALLRLATLSSKP